MSRTTRAAWVLLLACLGACAGAAPTPARDAAAEVTDATPLDAGACPFEDAGAAVTHDVPEAACCTQERCALSGTRCNPRTCRCEAVPCEALGARCDPAALPGVSGELVCAQDVGGLFCHAIVEDPAQCPALTPWCNGARPCVCGLGCRFFLDACPNGAPCVPALDEQFASGAATGICRGVPAGHGAVGAFCEGVSDCAAGLLCVASAGVPRCVRPDCGIAEAAPSCPAGRACRPLGSAGMLGVCSVPCDPLDVLAPCAANERCQRDARDPLGPAYCVALSDTALPGLGAGCLGVCRTGSTCFEGVCHAACRPGARPPDANACPGAMDCLPLEREWFCAQPCDPFAPAVAGACPAGQYCAPSRDACGAPRGHCLPRPVDLPRLGEPCYDRCDAGLACPEGALRRCMPLCVPGGPAGACPGDTRCFKARDDLPYGVCARPCVVGDGGCPSGAWCEPRWLDPHTDRWTGFCV